MSRTRDTLQSVVFYIALESTQQIYEYSFTAADFLDNLQVRQADENMFYTSISKDYRKIYLRNNFRVNDEFFGSPIGVCFIYENGEKEWVKRVDAQSTNAKNIHTMVGKWMENMTFTKWRDHVNYKGHPYIGKAENAIIVTMGYYEPEHVEPPPVIEDPVPEPPKKPDPEPEVIPPEVIAPPDPEMPFTFVPTDERMKEPMLANLMLRNARYRGPRESYKELMQQDEFLYDAHILYATMDYFKQMTDAFYRNLYGEEVESDKFTAKRVPETFEGFYAGISASTLDFRNTRKIQEDLNKMQELLDTIGEVRNNYE